MRNIKTLIGKNVPMKLRKYAEVTSSFIGERIFYALNHADKKVFRDQLIYWREKYSAHLKNRAIEEIEPFIVPAWKGMAEKVADYFATKFETNFLEQDEIKGTMFFTKGGTMQKNQLAGLLKHFGSRLSDILKENPLGHPKITSLHYLTSHNTIHHASHVVNFATKTGVDLFSCNRVVEWGGGFGNFVRLLKRQRPLMTYIIIDLPVFSFIQATYLSTIFGRDSVRLIDNSNTKIIEGKINIIPLDEKLLEKIDMGKVDAFVSTWALSESTDYAQSFVERMNFFKAKSVLIAHQKRSDTMKYAEDIEKRLKGFDIVYHEQIPYLITDYYLFAKTHAK